MRFQFDCKSLRLHMRQILNHLLFRFRKWISFKQKDNKESQYLDFVDTLLVRCYRGCFNGSICVIFPPILVGGCDGYTQTTLMLQGKESFVFITVLTYIFKIVSKNCRQSSLLSYLYVSFITYFTILIPKAIYFCLYLCWHLITNRPTLRYIIRDT